MKEEIIQFYSDGLKLEGVLRYPESFTKPVPTMILLHGSMGHDRNGNMLKTPDNKKILPKNMFLEISRRLCSAGFATCSWDKRGFGKSQGQAGDYFSQARDAKAAIDLLVSRKDIVNVNRIAVFGQSAGVLVACLLAKDDNRPWVYVLSGGLYSEYKDMMSFNYHRARDYAQKSPEHLKWVEENDLWGLVLGINLDKMFEAIERGENKFVMTYKGQTWNKNLDLKTYAPENSCKNQFKYIKKPALIIHGDADLNVPVEDAIKIKEELNRNGNTNAKLVIINSADHSFQQAAPDYDTRIRERMSLASFKRPFVESYFQNIIDFLKKENKN
ncbi:MAG: alpha/beta hydrolase [Candidatus Bathyarchaeota archaeon]|nr:alpha/beta hydrolase [Candidatus Bathyarchaeum sp.]